MNPSAIAHLCKCEPRFAAHVERIGPITLQKAEYTDPFVALLRSITYQQLAGNAARAIWLRVLALFEGAMPSAESLLRLSDETLRSAGLSRSKAAAMRGDFDGAPRARRIWRIEKSGIAVPMTLSSDGPSSLKVIAIKPEIVGKLARDFSADVLTLKDQRATRVSCFKIDAAGVPCIGDHATAHQCRRE